MQNKKNKTLHPYIYDDLKNIKLFQDYESWIAETMSLLNKDIKSSDPQDVQDLLRNLESRRMRLAFIFVNAKAIQDKAIGKGWREKPSGHGYTSRNKAEVDEEVYHYTYLRNLLEQMLETLDKKLSYIRLILQVS